MGYALQWAAVRNGRLDSMCSVFGLRATGEREEFAESHIVGAELPSGWSLILFQRSTISDDHLQELSKLGEVVSCFVEDHVMFSTASGWSDGVRIWSLTHDCEKGRSHMETQGNAPAALDDIHRGLADQQKTEGGEQADVDYLYDAPAELAKALVGFRHDEDVEGASGAVFQVLERIEPQGRKGVVSLLGQIFGKKDRTK